MSVSSGLGWCPLWRAASSKTSWDTIGQEEDIQGISLLRIILSSSSDCLPLIHSLIPGPHHHHHPAISKVLALGSEILHQDYHTSFRPFLYWILSYSNYDQLSSSSSQILFSPGSNYQQLLLSLFCSRRNITSNNHYIRVSTAQRQLNCRTVNSAMNELQENQGVEEKRWGGGGGEGDGVGGPSPYFNSSSHVRISFG